MIYRIFCFYVFMSVTSTVYAAKTLRPIWGEMPKNHDMVVGLDVGTHAQLSVQYRWWVRQFISTEFGFGFENLQTGFITSGVRLQVPNATPFWPWVLGQAQVLVDADALSWRQHMMIGGHFQMGASMEMWIAKGMKHAWFGLRYKI